MQNRRIKTSRTAWRRPGNLVPVEYAEAAWRASTPRRRVEAMNRRGFSLPLCARWLWASDIEVVYIIVAH